MTVANAGNGYGNDGNRDRPGGEPSASPAEQPQNLNVWRKALGRLGRDGLARRMDVSLKQRGGRRGVREFAHYLSDARKGETIVRGGRACGIKSKKRAKDGYGRVVPGHHTRRRNDFYIAMILRARELNAAAGKTVVDVPLEDVWAESCPDYPLRGAKITHDEGGKLLTGFDKQKAGYVSIEPDGRFRVLWPGQGWMGKDLACSYDVEVELGIRTGEVLDKIDERAACYSRLLERHHTATNSRRAAEMKDKYPEETFLGLPHGMVPVLFFLKTDASAKNMRDRVRAFFEGEDESLASLIDLQRRPQFAPVERTDADGGRYDTGGVLVGRYFLFAGLDLAEGSGGGDPFGRVFWPIGEYPMHLRGEGKPREARVSLEDVARERAETDLRKVREDS